MSNGRLDLLSVCLSFCLFVSLSVIKQVFELLTQLKNFFSKSCRLTPEIFEDPGGKFEKSRPSLHPRGMGRSWWPLIMVTIGDGGYLVNS